MFVRPLSDEDRHSLTVSLRSSDAFVLRRCQILLASARGQRAPQIARALGCNDQTVRNAIVAFNTTGFAALQPGSSVPHTIRAAFDAERAAQLQTLLHQSPRTFGKATSVWTLDLAAEVCFEQGVTPTRVTGETIRATLARLGVRFQRAKQWIVSPDPAYARKKTHAIG